MKRLDIEGNPDKFVVYKTQNKVVGLMKLPLDGNPNKTMGLIAHPDQIVDLTATTDGKFVFTAGGTDLALNMWSTDV